METGVRVRHSRFHMRLVEGQLAKDATTRWLNLNQTASTKPGRFREISEPSAVNLRPRFQNSCCVAVLLCIMGSAMEAVAEGENDASLAEKRGLPTIMALAAAR